MIRATDAEGDSVIGGLARGVLAAVLVVAAVSKLTDRKASREAIVEFGVSFRAAGVLGSGLIVSELAIATAVLLDPSTTAGATAALALLAIVSAAVGASMIRGRRPECRCFGQLSRDPIGSSTLARNGLLASIAGYVAAGGHAPVLFAGLGLLSGAAWRALSPSGLRARRGDEAPGFSATDAAGAEWTLRMLLGKRRPVLLVFSHPACGACQALRPDLHDWHTRLGELLTVVVIDQAPAAEPAAYPVLFDPAGEVATAYGVTATPSAVLVESDGRLASAVARGAAEMEALLSARFDAGDEPRVARRTMLLRAARGATTLGAFPLLAAACGSTSSPSSATSSTSATTTNTSSTSPTSVKVGSAYICLQKYALCTNAPCRPDPHNPKVVICDCVVKGGYSVGLTPCAQRAPHGSTLYSTFSTELVTGNVRAMTCGASIPWANCVGAPCKLDGDDPSKATCACPVVKTGPSFTFGGNCDTGTCGKTVWSGAHTNLGGPQVAAALKRLRQPLATPQPCPKA
jgi:peroxiredoxin